METARAPISRRHYFVFLEAQVEPFCVRCQFEKEGHGGRPRRAIQND